MAQTDVELHNRSGAGGVVVARFETAADTVGTLHVAGGASQRFENFDRLTVTAPEAEAGQLRLLNHGRPRLELRLLTAGAKGGEMRLHDLASGAFADVPVAGGQQLTIQRETSEPLPAPPLVHFARFAPEHPAPIFAPNQKPREKPREHFVTLRWSHPLEGTGKLAGYNLYRAVYEGNRPLAHHALNALPHQGLEARIADVRPPPPFNARYAVAAINRDGQEGAFSNIRILDASVRDTLIDAGFMPL